MKKTTDRKGSFSLAVIGGGASGLFAAIAAAKEAQRERLPLVVTVFEKNARVGKKILVTGNGRCNLTNENMSSFYYRGCTDLFDTVYSSFDSAQTLEWFAQTGLYTRSDAAGRIYPLSNQASSVLDALRSECRRLGVREFTDTKIESIRKNGTGFLLNSEFYADKVIFACGGKAAPVHGSDGSGLELLKNCGIAVTPTYPALTALNVRNFTKSLKGIRAEGAITLRSGGKTLASSQGEIQYTDYGLSGIPVMQISRFAAVSLGKGGEVFAFVDSLPSVSAEELTELFINLKKRDPARSFEDVLGGVMPKKLGAYMLTLASLSPSVAIGSVYDAAIAKTVGTIKRTKYTVSSVRDFAEAQVTAGGVAGEELDPFTLELKKLPGVYVCGEMIDVDGDCGGYNLQWAFSSGAVAGKSIVGEFIKCFA